MSCSLTDRSARMNSMDDRNFSNTENLFNNHSDDEDSNSHLWPIDPLNNPRIADVNLSRRRLDFADTIFNPPRFTTQQHQHQSVFDSSVASGISSNDPFLQSQHTSPNPLQLQSKYDPDDSRKPASRPSPRPSIMENRDIGHPYQAVLREEERLRGGLLGEEGALQSGFLSRAQSFDEDQEDEYFVHAQRDYAYGPDHHATAAAGVPLPMYPPPPTHLMHTDPMPAPVPPLNFRLGDHAYLPSVSDCLVARGNIESTMTHNRSHLPPEQSHRSTRNYAQKRPKDPPMGSSSPRPYSYNPPTDFRSHPSRGSRQTHEPLSYRGQRQYAPAASSVARSAAPARRQTPPKPSTEELDAAQNKRARDALYTWYDRLGELHAYHAEHGDCNVPQQYEANRRLGIWVNKQRMEKKAWDSRTSPYRTHTSLTEQKVQHLEEIGFVWAKPKGDTSWNIKYKELKKYYSENGHCNVPTKYKPNPALGRWVSTQRSQYKDKMKGKPDPKISDERIELLNSLKFTWDMVVKPEEDEGKGGNDSSTSHYSDHQAI